jgi:DNA (cytosine-5)-methyltransferase 1
MTGLVVDLFAGPGGVGLGLRALGLGLDEVGLELDAATCATRAAAGPATIRADVARYPAGHLAGWVWDLWASPPCQLFSQAGSGLGKLVLAELADAVRDAFAGQPTIGRHRRRVARALQAHLAAAPKTRQLPRAERSARAWQAAHQATLVVQPARWVHACRPAWVALEQVPEVLPLWRVYAAELRQRGYATWTGMLNAADYGVAQTRRRAILIASLDRKVDPPEPTHHDPRRGGCLFGLPPWVSMATALGWGPHQPARTVAGHRNPRWAYPPGERTGQVLAVETEPTSQHAHGRVPYLRDAGRPAPTVVANADRWLLHTGRDQRPDGTRQTTDPADDPAPTVTGKAGSQWRLWTNHHTGDHRQMYQRDAGRPAPTVTGRGDRWVLRTGNSTKAGTRPGGLARQPDDPAPTVDSRSSQWTLRTGHHDRAGDRSIPRSLDQPAPTVALGHTAARWAYQRPATTVAGTPRVGQPRHKDRDPGTWEASFERDAVPVTLQELAVLQGFPPDYPFWGTKSQRCAQIGNAVPPQLAAAIVGALTGHQREEVRR